MTPRPAIWGGGIAGSLLAHGALLGVLLVAIEPEPVDPQPTPQSELEVQAYRLDRTQARQQRPDSQPANAEDASGASLAAGAIPQSRANALPPPVGETLSGAAPAADRLRADAARPDELKPARPLTPILAPATATPTALTQTQPATPLLQAAVLRTEPALAQVAPPATRLARADVPAGVTLAAMTDPGVAVAETRPETTALAVAAPPDETLPQVRPAAPSLPGTAPQSTPLPSAAPALQAAAPQRIAASVAPPAPPEAQRLKAALAFSGAGDGEIDPVSLAAFQSFMRPGDIRASGDALRDGVSALLAQVPCSRLQVGFDPDTATLQVNGHIPEGDLRAPVLAALQAQMGADITVSDNILILPRPQCGALSGIGDIGLAQSTDQITNPLLIGEDTQARVLNFVRDDRLFFDIIAPDYDAYVYVDYFDAGGNVLHLAPNDQVPLRLAPAKSALRIGT